jgi:hypothetical protein
MAWVSEVEVESSESQTMFISHIYATERLRAGNAMLVNYVTNPQSLHTGVFRGSEMSLVLRVP